MTSTPQTASHLAFAAAWMAVAVFTSTGNAQSTPPTVPGQPQQQQQPANATRPIWRCELPGGVYEVAANAIISVSSHSYTVDAGARVTEVNVETTGSLLVRFYYLELPSAPIQGLGAATINKLQSLGTEAADRSVGDAWRKVVKNYPSTTHARTVEYRLSASSQLDEIFKSASTAFRTGRAGSLKISE